MVEERGGEGESVEDEEEVGVGGEEDLKQEENVFQEEKDHIWLMKLRQR